MRGEAHLYRLADGLHLAAIIYNAFNLAVIPALGMDLALIHDKPEDNVQSLVDQLYDHIHDYAQAHLGAKVQGVNSNFEL